MRIASVVVVSCVSCVSSNTLVCDDGRICPEATQCDETHHLCVTDDQVSKCTGMPDQMACTLPDQRGNCQQEVCLPIECGNTRVDLGETCDDGGTMAGDGCAADCTSTEACGNSFIDRTFDETCDDGNLVDHDGCSSSCQSETANWSRATPPKRAVAAATFDARLQEIVMFGGSDVGSGPDPTIQFNDLWGWNGQWHQLPRALGPSARNQAAMAYDAAHGRTILFGGTRNGEILGETWAWDGTGWTRLADGPRLFDAAMAYDARRKRLVVFGGSEDTLNATADTWVNDGSGWVKLPAGPAPLPRQAARMAYDPERDKIVLFGGINNTPVTYFHDTWEFDASGWNPVTVSTPPPDLHSAHLAYDRTSHRMVLFGGLDNNFSAQDITYVFANGNWATTSSTRSPDARSMGIMTEDGNGGVILFGGYDSGNGELEDTWRWDGSEWTPQTLSGVSNLGFAYDYERRVELVYGGQDQVLLRGDTYEISAAGLRSRGTFTPLAHVAMTYDGARHEVLRFGGRAASTPTNELAAWTGSTWATRSGGTPPSARYGATFAYDPVAKASILFGGKTDDSTWSNETWSWNGTTWTKLQPANAPHMRSGAAMNYDWVHGYIVMFGGTDNDAITFDDTWIWDGTNWREAQIPMAMRPHPRVGGALVWNAKRGRLVLTLGNTPSGDAWEWDGAAWQEVLTFDLPPANRDGIAFPEPDGSGISTAAGRNSIMLSPSDPWRFAYDGPRESDACVVPSEVDGDKAAGCLDRDCWAVCTPGCPPGAPCATDAPRCGDGACSISESCHTCPPDCTTCVPTCGDFICDPSESCPGDCP